MGFLPMSPVTCDTGLLFQYFIRVLLRPYYFLLNLQEGAGVGILKTRFICFISVLHACMCTMCVPPALGDQKRASDPLEL